jgi:mono/diheme cytochrome c family protein
MIHAGRLVAYTRRLGLLALTGVCYLVLPLAGLKGTPQTTKPLGQAPGSISPGSARRALVDKYCVTCHNERLHTAGLLLDKVSADDVTASGDIWEKVVRKVRTGEMPPAGMPRPDKATFDTFASELETALDHAAATKPNPGRVALHRLNRTEYVNAIRDLLALEIDGRSFLIADDVDQHGFDDIADVLSVSPVLMEQYMSAARKVSRLATGDPTILPVFETYTVPSTMNQDGRMNEDLPFGSRGGIAVSHHFPLDGEYEIKIRLQRTIYSYVRGMGRRHQLEVRVNGERIKLFTVGGDAPSGQYSPATFSGNIMGDPKWDLYLHEADKGLQLRFPAKAGTATVKVSFLKDTPEFEEIPQPLERDFGLNVDEMYLGNPAVDSVEIGGPTRVDGPGDTPSRRRIFVCRPDAGSAERLSAATQPCARKIVATLARRAFRRPVTDAEVAMLLGFYESGRKQGGFEGGIRLALERMLADPRFLFRVERDPPNAAPGTVYRLSDLELASRLSFFLWSTIPDDQLINLAVAGKLKESAILEQQVRRMLTDDRADALVLNFANQWLELPKVRGFVPDPERFPDFDDNLRDAFMKETELFIRDQMRADLGIGDLLTAHYTFANDRLARHYGIPNVYGSHFRKVTFPNEQRGGLLGHGSVLMATSYPNRTSPVLRGKWLLGNILGMPPPPPPPNVPPLKENGTDDKATTVRERMEQHRNNPACMGCHARMDPLGFALENFDAVGSWRTTSDGLPIDASGSLVDGTKLDGSGGLRKMLLSRGAQFAETFSTKLLTYGIGREVEYYDLPAVRKIVRDAAANGYRWSSVILGVVRSVPFQMSIVNNAAPQMAAASGSQNTNGGSRK